MVRFSMLNRKMLRDIRKNFSQFLTIFAMILIAMMAFAGIKAYMIGMERSAERYYTENNLQDLDAYGKFTDDTVAEIAELEHVEKAEGKLSLLAEMKGEYDGKDVQLNFIRSNEISKFYVVDGEEFDAEKSGVWLDEYFAKNLGVKVGDKIKASYDGLELEEEVRGLIYTPDHVGYVKDDTEIFPTHDQYGFAYVSMNELPETMHSYSTVMIDVDDEANKSAVKIDVTDHVDGVLSVIDIKDEYSYASYQGEIDEGKTYVGIFSGLFIAIGLLCVVTTMARIVRKDRTQIGVMKALGYSDARIAWHYISYGLLLSVIGGVTGLLIGYFWFGNFFLALEQSYFEIANLHSAFDASCYAMLVGVIVGTCLTCYLTVRNYVRQPAAEILRVERPKVKRGSLNFTTGGLFGKMSFAARWNLRDIVRNKARTLTGLVGVIGCMILLVCGLGINDTMHEYMRVELELINNYKYRLNIAEDATDEQVANILAKYPRSAKTLGVEIKKDGELKAKVASVNDAGDYLRVYDETYRNQLSLDDDGVYVTRKFAKTEGYEIGDEIEWHIYGSNKYYRSKIIGLYRDPQTQGMTMSKAYYESLDLKYVPDAVFTDDEVAVADVPGVVSLQSIDDVREGVNKMLETMMKMVALLVVLAALLGAIIIYNMGILSFAEKDYQFATLKVLGFSDRKIGHIFVQQNIWVAVVAILLGLPIGYYLTDYLFRTAIKDTYDFGANITTRSYVCSAVGTFVVSVLVSLWLTRKIGKIDMVKSLKANE